MTGDDQLRLARNGSGVTIDVTGKVDEETALALGNMLDSEFARGSAMTIRIADADMSMIGWAILERAARTSIRRGVPMRLEPDPGPVGPTRRMARDWLDVIEEACRQPQCDEELRPDHLARGASTSSDRLSEPMPDEPT